MAAFPFPEFSDFKIERRESSSSACKARMIVEESNRSARKTRACEIVSRRGGLVKNHLDADLSKAFGSSKSLISSISSSGGHERAVDHLWLI